MKILVSITTFAASILVDKQNLTVQLATLFVKKVYLFF